MQQKKLKLSTVLLLGLGLSGLQAQEATCVSGGDASGSGGSVSYSIGQLVYNTNSGTSGSVAQGLQQPFEIFALTEIEKAKGIMLKCSAFPNPARDYLTLNISGDDLAKCTAYLYDINGKLLESKIVENNEATILMSGLVPSTYFLKVIQDNKVIKTFEIIKK